MTHAHRPVGKAPDLDVAAAHDAVTMSRTTLADLVFSPYVAVRQRAAENPATTVEALAILADDADAHVRRAAAHRLGRFEQTHQRAS